jgi:hypothetical protein
MAGLAGALAAPAQGLDQTCELSATRFDPDTVNILFPDQSAQYWSADYVAVPGTRIRIDGIFPYSRYTSWNVYDAVLRPFAKLSDYQLVPDPGSANPFLPGASRTTGVSERHYTLFITFSPADHPGPNTIYVDPSTHPLGVFTLRVYVPDAGLDATGGVGLPQVTWEPTSSTGPPPTASPCQRLEKPSSTALTKLYTGLSGPAGLPYPGRNPPVWNKFVNICQSGADLLLENEFGAQPPAATPNLCANFGSGGFLSNLDISYVYAFTSTGFGPLLVLHGKAPTFAATYPHAPVMPSGEQVRYWSFCQNDPILERYIACARDDQVKLDGSGDYTIVLSPPSSWPAAAARRCSGTVTWIPWGLQPDGVIIYRQMLPDPSFTQAIQNVSHGSEQQQMGAYYPGGQYFSRWQNVAHAYC